VTLAQPIRRLAAVLEAIHAELPGEIVYRVGGEEELAKNDPARRVVMEPRTRRWEAGHGAGQGPSGVVVRALWTRVELVRMHIWGGSMEQVEEIEEVLANAIVKVCAWAVRPAGGEWVGSGHNQRGLVATQDLEFLIPIVRRETKAPLTFADTITPVIG
jgi:hypothetical protein